MARFHIVFSVEVEADNVASAEDFAAQARRQISKCCENHSSADLVSITDEVVQADEDDE